MKRTRITAIALGLSALLSSAAYANLEVKIGYLSLEQDKGPVLSNILPEPDDAGEQGATLAIADSNTTGRFLKQNYTLTAARSDQFEAVLNSARQQLADGIHYFVTDLPATELSQLSAELGDKALILNAGAQDDALRTEQCLPNVLHTTPSRAMLTDALGQWLKARRMTRWLLITGSTEDDQAYAQALKRAAKRFGHTIVAEKAWSFDTDLRRTAQTEMPLFTQTKEYDVVVVADERGDFGEYVLFNTWLPRPVVGTQGLTPVTWHRVVEQWGAAQLQSRFEKQANRWMNGKDYAAWAAVRTVAEAVTRTNTTDLTTVRNFIASDQFELAAFKGRKLNYRGWSGQLRQPIPLVHPRSLVSQSPQEGFLHPETELDTLGFDAPESQCRIQQHLVTQG